MTWNLWAFDIGRAVRRSRIIEALRAIRPDICCLQEVRSDEREDFAETIADALGLAAERSQPVGVEWWQRRLDDPTAEVSNVVLSRWPTSDTATLALPADRTGDEQRSALFVRTATPAGPLLTVATQLTSSPLSSALRSQQVRAIARSIAERRQPDDLVILAGDLNADPDSDEVRLLCGHKTPPAADRVVLLDAWRFAPPSDPGWTWDRRNPYVAATGEPDSRLDYILLGPTPAGRLPVVNTVEVAGDAPAGATFASDHFAVMVEVELPIERAWKKDTGATSRQGVPT